VINKQQLKLVVAYDRNRNEYSLVEHNQQPGEAQRLLEQWTRHLRSDCSFIVLAQAKRHRTDEVQNCRACREIVARSAHLEPQPKFKRRQQ
jgi:hypothetical protein